MSWRPLIIMPAALVALAILPAAAPQQPSAGAALYKQRCQTCHTVAPGVASALGPNLAGVVGRKAASTSFRYSPALQAAKLTWTRENLDRFLTAPTKLVPGTRMIISVADARQRADLIKYLETAR